MSAPVEMSRPLAIERLAHGPVDMAVEADAAECAAIAVRLLLPAVQSLVCHFHLESAAASARPGEILARGRLLAEVTRECVVTLDPFPSVVTEDFQVRFVVEGTESENEDPDADDEVPYGGAVIDLGEAAVEQLALALDPYPRKPGAELPETSDDRGDHPFAGLARLPRAT